MEREVAQEGKGRKGRDRERNEQRVSITLLPSPPSSMSAKPEHITELQRELEDAMRKRGQPVPAYESSPASHTTSYCFVRGDEEGRDGGRVRAGAALERPGPPTPR